MKKIVKLSLATSVALASLTCANAKSLEEAIKNVDVSGTMAVRYNDYEEQTAKNNGLTQTQYKIALNIKSKVNDDITANTRIIMGNQTGITSFTEEDGDTEMDVSVSEANFAYSGIKNTVVTVGKQGFDTAFSASRDSIGDEQTGSAISIASTFGPVSVNAAYFNTTNLQTANDFATSSTFTTFDGTENAINVGAAVTLGNIALDASYLDIESKFDAYTAGISASYDLAGYKLSSYARYSSLDLDDSATDNKLWKAGIKVNKDIYGFYLAYGQTDDEGGVVGVDASGATGFDEHWRVTLTGEQDSSVIYAAVDAQVTPKLNVALKFSDLDDDKAANQDQQEVYTQVAYQMSKNFLTYVRFGQLKVDNRFTAGEESKSTIGRVHMQYSF